MIHTRESLGVPDWYKAECSLPLPGPLRRLVNGLLPWTEGPCAAHDWAYHVGSSEREMNALKAQADRDFRARLKENAEAVGHPGTLGEVYYWSVVFWGRRRWRVG